jgi:ribosome biogenesis ATPase
LFFDELDALVPNREGGGGNEASARVVNTLLTELDGLDSRDGIYVIGATNRPDIIDPAMLRPGRLEKLLYVGLPGPEERVSILKTLISRTPIESRLAEFASREACANFSGADLESLIRQAGLMTLERGSMKIEEEDFATAVSKVRPSVQNIERYERMRLKLQSG